MADAIIMTIEGVRTRASTGEALVTFAVPLENAALVSGFMAKVGKQVGAAFADIDKVREQNGNLGGDKPKINETKPYGMEARALKLSGFFRTPEVWAVLGTDDDYREWVQRQPSAWSGGSDWVDALGEGRCEAAHVRRIATGTGMQIKNDYACIPLTHKEHLAQSNHGESVFDGGQISGHGSNGEGKGREWMERMRIHYVSEWGWQRLKEELGYESMGNVPPPVLFAWAQERDVDRYLPAEYRG